MGSHRKEPERVGEVVGDPMPRPRVRPGQPGVIELSWGPDQSKRITLGIGLVPHRQGEDGVLEVCQRLVEHLAALGIHWGVPSIPAGPEEGVDCVCESDDGLVKIQITRAIRDPEFFEMLGKHDAVNVDTTIEELASNLWKSIQHKANRTPRADRSQVVLVLDSSEFFIVTDETLLGHFDAAFGEKAKCCGFRSIWLVGSHHSFVAQLAK